MSTILQQLPFLAERSTVQIPDGPVVEIKHHQIIVWLSITQPALPEFPHEARRFPAVLDTGFNNGLLIQFQQIGEWAGLKPQDFTLLDHMLAYGRSIPMLDADLWIHRNRAGRRDEFSRRLPFRVQLDSGIGVCPAGLNNPRLPLLGMLGLTQSQVRLHLDCEHYSLSMHTSTGTKRR